MNKRIFELAQEAGYSSWELNPSKETMSDALERLRKFALLIVQEVANVLHDNELWNLYISHVLNEHFGVEE